jgi:hypothetical protein
MVAAQVEQEAQVELVEAAMVVLFLPQQHQEQIILAAAEAARLVEPVQAAPLVRVVQVALE